MQFVFWFIWIYLKKIWKLSSLTFQNIIIFKGRNWMPQYLISIVMTVNWWDTLKLKKIFTKQAFFQLFICILITENLFYACEKLVLEKAEEPEIKLPTSAGSWKKEESSRKTSMSALLTMPKPLTVWITINCGKFWKRWECQTTWPASWEICMQAR